MGDLEPWRGPGLRLPPAMGAAERRALARAVNLAGSKSLTEDMIRREVVDAFRARAAELEQRLKPAEPDAIAAVLASLDRMVDRREVDAAEAEFAVRVAVGDLGSAPEFALAEAARDFRCHVVGDGKFRPTTGELRKRAAEIAAPHFAELAQIRGLRLDHLPARKPVDPERRKALAEMLRRAAGAMASGTPTAREGARTAP